MTRKLVAVIGPALLGAGLVAAACAAVAPETHVVEMRAFRFQPERVTVAVGDTVVWIDRDAVPHTATASDGGWDSGEVASGARWSWVAARPGVVAYVCAYHPTMRGEIVVE